MVTDKRSEVLSDDEVEANYKDKYRSLVITNNRSEIQEISEQTLKYLKEDLLLNNKTMMPWEFVPLMASEVIKSTILVIVEQITTDNTALYVNLADICRITIEYAETEDADKIGTFNPKIDILEGMEYGKPYKTIPCRCDEFIDSYFDSGNIDIINKIAGMTAGELRRLYNVNIQSKDAPIIMAYFVGFMRKIKDFIEAHKDDGDDWGYELDIAGMFYIGVAKEDTDDGVKYINFMTPSAKMKQSSKDDAKTEIK